MTHFCASGVLIVAFLKIHLSLNLSWNIVIMTKTLSFTATINKYRKSTSATLHENFLHFLLF